MHTAYERGFNVFTLVDCVAATSEEEQQVAIEKDYPMFSHPVDHNEFLNILSGETMSAVCLRATELGIETIAFTEHVERLPQMQIVPPFKEYFEEISFCIVA